MQFLFPGILIFAFSSFESLTYRRYYCPICRSNSSGHCPRYDDLSVAVMIVSDANAQHSQGCVSCSSVDRSKPVMQVPLAVGIIDLFVCIIALGNFLHN